MYTNKTTRFDATFAIYFCACFQMKDFDIFSCDEENVNNPSFGLVMSVSYASSTVYNNWPYRYTVFHE